MRRTGQAGRSSKERHLGSQPSREYKICPSCAEEFTLVMEVCADCSVRLVYPDEIAPEPQPEDFPDTDVLECVRVGPLPWTRALSEQLSHGSIEHRVEPDSRSEEEGGVDPRRFGGEPIYGTWVMPDDLAAATALDSEIFAHLEPEAQAEAEVIEACPACGHSLSPEALECPDCGLRLG
jgi:hypothetical protein